MGGYEMKVVELQVQSFADITGGLRRLADAIDAGEYGDVCNVAWVVDADYQPLEVGLLGRAQGSPDAVCVLLLEAGKLNLLGRMGK
jgi:hypothetical protein